MTAIIDIVCGTTGGLVQIACGHPLDTIKVRLQTQSTTTGRPFTGLLDCGAATFRQEGFAGLYKGAMSPLAFALFSNAACFCSFGQAEAFLKSRRDTAGPLAVSEVFLAGCFTGAVVSLFETPSDLAKSLMQTQVGPGGKFTGPFNCARHIIRERGVTGLFHGGSATLARNVPQFGGFFAAYHYVETSLTPVGASPSALTYLLGGAAAGLAAWGPWLYPFDVIKTRIQTDSIVPAHRQYQGWLDCVRKTIARDGLSSLYRGLTPTLVRAIPVNAAIFFAVKSTKKKIMAD